MRNVCLTTPLFEVYSVRIFSDHTHGKQHNTHTYGKKAYTISGRIQIIDGEGVSFTLYDRKHHNPEFVFNGGKLTLNMPQTLPMMPSNNVITMLLSLYVNIGDTVENLKGLRTCDYMNNDDYDELKTQTINGVHSWAAIDYVTYQHAIFATLQVKLLKGENADVDGKIVTRLGNSYSTILFEKGKTKSVKVKYGCDVDLCRYVVVVPALSFLLIDINLCNRRTKERIVCKFYTKHGFNSYSSLFKKQKGIVALTVLMDSPSLQPSPERRVKVTALSERNWAICDQSHLSAEIDMMNYFWTKNWIEVFSISVHSMSGNEELNLYGLVTLDDYPVFDRDETSPLRFFRNQILPIKFPIHLLTGEFDLVFDLKNVDGHVISKGSVYWHDPYLHYGEEPPFNERLCCIINGDDGYYAAVHYTVFEVAFAARVKIYLNDKSSFVNYRSKVHGCILAQYDEYQCRSFYDKKFFRRKLFEVSSSTFVQYSGSKILLSEPLIVVPVNSSLIVDVDLRMILELIDDSFDEGKIYDSMLQGDETFKDKLYFKGHQKLMSTPFEDYIVVEQKIIDGTLKQIVVCVEWSIDPDWATSNGGICRVE